MNGIVYIYNNNCYTIILMNGVMILFKDVIVLTSGDEKKVSFKFKINNKTNFI